MKLISDNLNPEEAWKRLSACVPLPVVSASLEQAFDHILATDLSAMEDVPSGNRSFRDGFAVRSADVSRVPVSLRLAGEIPMGIVPAKPVGPGQTMTIPTGGFLPDDADAVVMQEDTERTGDEILVNRIDRFHFGKRLSDT